MQGDLGDHGSQRLGFVYFAPVVPLFAPPNFSYGADMVEEQIGHM